MFPALLQIKIYEFKDFFGSLHLFVRRAPSSEWEVYASFDQQERNKILSLETRAVPHYLPCQNKKYAAFARHQISTHVGTDFTPNLICVTAPSRGWKVNVLFDQQAGKHLCDPVILKPDLACTRGCRMASATKIYRAFGSCTSWHGFLVISEGFPLYKRMTENISNQTVSTIPLQKKEVKADQQT